jgi:hypothetical protein
MSKLKGDELLEHIKEKGALLDRNTLIADAGYIVTRNGRPSLQRTEFMQAMADAQGMTLGPPSAGPGRGKNPGFKLKVGPKGMVPVGAAYTSKIGLTAGQHVLVEIDGDCIVLRPTSEDIPVCPV